MTRTILQMHQQTAATPECHMAIAYTPLYQAFHSRTHAVKGIQRRAILVAGGKMKQQVVDRLDFETVKLLF